MRLKLAFMVLSACLMAAPASANDAEVRGPSLDFKFMQLRQHLRENPSGDSARHDHFAIGEYYFRQGMPKAAAESFRHIDPSYPRNQEELLAAVYLLRCASLTGDKEAAAERERALLEFLSSKQFIAAFGEAEVKQWVSPLGNRYTIREEVDRLEISLNGSPFHVIDLS